MMIFESIISLLLQGISAAASSVSAGTQVKEIWAGSAKAVKEMSTHVISEDLKTLREPLDIILNIFKANLKLQGIRIYGGRGVGKTTIMENLNNHEDVGNWFDIVIWLTVSTDSLGNYGQRKNLDLKTLQTKVMRRLNLDTSSTQPEEYKDKIMEYLKDKKYLLLLDNVKESVDPYEIGFPKNWEQKGSKIVLTTRYKKVCSRIVDHHIEIGLLTVLEAKIMFQGIFKPTNDESRKRMEERLKWCNGLPVAIAILAGNRNEIMLEHFPEHEDDDDEIKKLYEHFRFCCEDLDGGQLNCLLYAALYSEECDIYIDRLLDCWMAEKFLLKNDKHDRAHGKEILQILYNRNLFQKNEGKKCVRMLKTIRLVALYKLKNEKENKYLVPFNEESTDEANMGKWEGKRWISFADYKNLKRISNSHDCPELSTLFLQENSKFEEFPNLFFTKVGSLCVLDLMGTNIKSLPESLTGAKNLAVLYLNECNNLLKLPPEIGNLNYLEVLDIRGSQVKNVRDLIPRLKHLKRILVPRNTFSDGGTLDIVSGPTELEEMVIDTESEKETYKWEIIDTVMESVKSLTRLTSLQFRFLNDEVVDVIKVVDKVTIIYAHKEDNLKYFVEKPDLDSGLFRAFIGCLISEDVKILNGKNFQRYMKYFNGKEESPTSVLKLLPKVDAVVIAKNDTLKDLMIFDFSKASAIQVENCSGISCIFHYGSVLANLQRLCLSDLPKLVNMFSDSICLSNLCRLESLQVTRCQELITIINIAAAPGQEPLEFPKLEELILVDLEKLTSICTNESLGWPALTTLKIDKCRALKTYIYPDKAKLLKDITIEKKRGYPMP